MRPPETWRVDVGSCLNLMCELPTESVDAVVTDPPYEISFMGREWDSTGIAYQPETWAECLRVLKPGGHLLAFTATRTYHRIACAVEDAGFEIRDMVEWIYGTGFPKSLDVSKAIDKLDARDERRRRNLSFTAWLRSTGVTARALNEATGSLMGGHYLTAAEQPHVPTAEHWRTIVPLLDVVEIPAWIEKLVHDRDVESKNFAAREVVGERVAPDGTRVRLGFSGSVHSGDDAGATRVIQDTRPATDEARAWKGWGSALKPSHEPIILARKPLDGTVAENVLAHGTGALNVDGCRIVGPAGDGAWSAEGVVGRWPANLILAEDSARALDKSGDEIEPSRFFYVAKPSRREREAGLLGFKRKRKAQLAGAANDGDLDDVSARSLSQLRANVHPTVKPVGLMAYLARLVTPPGGLILDPLTGSGSTGCGAVCEGYRFLGFELSDEYAEIARARIEYWAAGGDTYDVESDDDDEDALRLFEAT